MERATRIHWVSSRTLEKALERMQDEGLVHRTGEIHKKMIIEYRDGKAYEKKNPLYEYPPPGYYGLTQEGRRQVLAQLFVHLLILDPSLRSTTLRPIRSDEETQKIFEDLGRKIGAIHLFVILKALEYRDLEWLDRLFDSRVDLNLFDSYITSRMVEPERIHDIKDFKFDESSKFPRDYSYYFRLQENEINKLITSLKSAFPDILPYVESLLRTDESFSENAI
jgi:hypothetical protein